MTGHSIGLDGTLFGASSFNDSQPVTTANAFVAAEDGWTCLGARLWSQSPYFNPTLAWAKGSVSSGAVDYASAPLGLKATPALPYDGSWVDVLWDTPFAMAKDEPYWLGYYSADNYYLAADNVSTDVPATDGSALALKVIPGWGSRGAFRYFCAGDHTLNAPDLIASNFLWGVDIIATKTGVVVSDQIYASGIMRLFATVYPAGAALPAVNRTTRAFLLRMGWAATGTTVTAKKAFSYQGTSYQVGADLTALPDAVKRRLIRRRLAG